VLHYFKSSLLVILSQYF